MGLVVAGLLLAGLVAAGAAWWAQRPAALYCVQQPGTVWNGLFALPGDLRPQCPASASYRREVRSGQSRVEQYRLSGWQPRRLLPELARAGYTLREDEIGGPGHYSVFLGRTAPAQLFYTAVQVPGGTLLTLSGQ